MEAGSNGRPFGNFGSHYRVDSMPKIPLGCFQNLCAAIDESKVSGVLLTISKETYKTCASEHLKSYVGNAYAVCVFLCVDEICVQTNNARVSFVLEQGQPNLRYVKGILEDMIDDGQRCVAAVASARKSDFIELHTADFLSHIASSHDVAWMKRLLDKNRLVHGLVTEELIRGINPVVTELHWRAKAARRKAKETL